jgi:acyl dehydratase
MSVPENFKPGYRAQTGSHTFTAAEIVAFAKKFDRQRFHLDAKAAKASLFGGLCASGWHTTAVWMRKQRDHMAALAARQQAAGIAPVEYGPSPGFRNLRWLKPVFAGDTVTFFSQLQDRRPSASMPGWQVLSLFNGADNQKGERVLEFESAAFARLGPGQD